MLLLAVLVAAACPLGRAWNTPYHTTFNYSTNVVDQVQLDVGVAQRMEDLLAPQPDDDDSEAAAGAVASPSRPRTLLAVTTSNVWERTYGLLLSLSNAAPSDDYDVLFIDECSSDGTRDELARLMPRAAVILVNETRGVTYHWNVAYQYFLDYGYEHLIISNNDVLVPPGAVTRLVDALEDGGCDLVSPLSTVNGKGHIGIVEGLEAVFNLSLPSAHQVESPYNYVRVQSALDELFRSLPGARQVHRRAGAFNGFFFAVSKRIAAAAAAPRALFSEQLFSFRQESDLAERMDKSEMPRCLHAGAFVFHYKASTIPQGHLHKREKFKAACESFHEQQLVQLQHRRLKGGGSDGDGVVDGELGNGGGSDEGGGDGGR